MIVGPDINAWKALPCPEGVLVDLYDEIARTIPECGTFVQIGVGYGAGLAYVIARFGPGVRSVAVDTWERHERTGLTEEQWDRVTSHGDAFEACLHELGDRAQYVYGRVTFIRDTSEEAATLMGKASVDVLLVERASDAEPWTEKMKPGGRIYT